MASSRSNGRLPKFQRVLMVSAHPDDPDFGAGGAIARLADSGAEVTYVIVTDGRQGGEDPKQKDSELIAIREREQRAAARVLGVKKIEFLGYKDGHLSPDLKLRHDIVRQIRKYKPELVITHIPGHSSQAQNSPIARPARPLAPAITYASLPWQRRRRQRGQDANRWPGPNPGLRSSIASLWFRLTPTIRSSRREDRSPSWRWTAPRSPT